MRVPRRQPPVVSHVSASAVLAAARVAGVTSLNLLVDPEELKP